MMRADVTVSEELKQILIADAVLTVAFAFALNGGVGGGYSGLIMLLPISALAITLNFILHEMMHKFTAQRYGAIAHFVSSRNGLIITLVSGLFGFLIGIPGATYIYSNRFTKKENGIVSLAGPLTNMAVFVGFLALSQVTPPGAAYLHSAYAIVIEISLFLAFFNMLPVFPLDGSKVLAWSAPIYVGTMAVIFATLYLFTGIGLVYVAYLVILALFFSFIGRMLLLGR